MDHKSMAINSDNRIIHRFIQNISAYEKGGEFYSQIIPLDVQAYAIYPTDEGNRLFYVIGDGEHTYLELREGKSSNRAYKEYPVFNEEDLEVISVDFAVEKKAREEADERLEKLIEDETKERKEQDEKINEKFSADLDKKLDKTSQKSVLYGTDGKGNQTTYDLRTLGTLSDVLVGEESVVQGDKAYLGTMASENKEDYYTKTETDEKLNSLEGDKLSKSSESNVIYGTDDEGNQTTYDYSQLGKIDDVTVDNVSVVEDKVAKLGSMATQSKLNFYTRKETDDLLDSAVKERVDEVLSEEDLVKYRSFEYQGQQRKTIQLNNYDSISGVTTEGEGANLVMLSKWDVADFGSTKVPLNLNTSKDRVTVNDDKELAYVDDLEPLKEDVEDLKEKVKESKQFEITTKKELDVIQEDLKKLDEIDEKLKDVDFSKFIQVSKDVVLNAQDGDIIQWNGSEWVLTQLGAINFFDE